MLRSAKQKGLTIVELVVVLGVMLILVSLLLPAVQNVRERARLMNCTNNLRQFGLATIQAGDAFDTLPFSFFPFEDFQQSDLTWGQRALAYFRGDLQSFASTGSFSTIEASTIQKIGGHLRCPSSLPGEQIEGLTAKLGSPVDLKLTYGSFDYRLSGGWSFDPVLIGDPDKTAFSTNRHQSKDRRAIVFPDGASNTWMAWETVGAKEVFGFTRSDEIIVRPWTFFSDGSMIFADDQQPYIAPSDSGCTQWYQCLAGTTSGLVSVDTLTHPSGEIEILILDNNSSGSMQSMHTNVINVCLADGAVMSIDRSISFDAMKRLIGINNGVSRVSTPE